MSSEETRFTLRVPGDLYAQLREWADQEERSVHNLIIVTLRRAVVEHLARQRAAKRRVDAGSTVEEESQIPGPAAELAMSQN